MSNLPTVPLRDLVLFPGMIIPLFVGREKSVAAIEEAGENKEILLVTQKDASIDDPKSTDLYKVGIVGKVLQILTLSDGTMKILVEGVSRVKVTKYTTFENKIIAEVKPMKTLQKISDLEIKAFLKALIEQFENYAGLNPKVSTEVLFNVQKEENYEAVCYLILSQIILEVKKKQTLLESESLEKLMAGLLEALTLVNEILSTENKIKKRVKSQIEKSQKEYLLNEQLKAIQEELGSKTKDEADEIDLLLKKIKLPKEARERVDSEIKKLKMMSPMSQEASVIRNYLEWIADIPWNKFSKINSNLQKAMKILQGDHYGLEKVKDRIVEFLAVNIRTKSASGPILCLIGPPGVGKTSLAQSIAKATGRKFVKVSLGGLRDEAEIRGHRRTYIGSMPGKIVQALKKAKTSNPVMLLDEIDKLGLDYRGDPSSALLEVLDPEQNKSFNDHYIEIDVDLSNVLFVATANSYDIARPLLDRMETINLSGYTEDEKKHIALEYLIPKQGKKHGLKDEEFEIKDNVIMDIIRFYTKEAGVRGLNREIEKIARKIVKKLVLNEIKKASITSDDLEEYLGAKKYDFGAIGKKNLIGVTNGLAYTEVGGDLLAIEAVKSHGKGTLNITGKLGDVMKESVQAAISYIRSTAANLGIEIDLLKDIDLHVHVPEGAVPKDGPSAGIAMYTALVSVLTNIPVRRDVAMTGEITLRGRVLAIGGLKEKLLAALRGGVTTVLIPKENEKNIKELPDNVKKDLKIIPIENVEEVLPYALEYMPVPLPKDNIEADKRKYVVSQVNLTN